MYLMTAVSILASTLPTQALEGPKPSISSDFIAAREGCAVVTWLLTWKPLLAARQNYILCGDKCQTQKSYHRDRSLNPRPKIQDLIPTAWTPCVAGTVNCMPVDAECCSTGQWCHKQTVVSPCQRVTDVSGVGWEWQYAKCTARGCDEYGGRERSARYRDQQ
jgi:hypothetical protein